MSQKIYILTMEKDGKLSYSMEFAWKRETLLESAIISIQRWMINHNWNDNDSPYCNNFIAIESFIQIKDFDKAIDQYNNTVWSRGLNHNHFTVSIKMDYVKGIPPNTLTTSSKIGHACKKCSTYYEYAPSNQTDGTYLCKSCAIFSNIFSA